MFFGLGVLEFLFFFFPFFFGGGVPLGCPPGPEDPILLKLANDESIAYAYWNGTRTPDPNADPTQKFLARPELGVFFKKFKTAMRKESLQMRVGSETEGVGAVNAEHWANIFDSLTWGMFVRPGVFVLEKVTFQKADGEIDVTLPPDLTFFLALQLGDGTDQVTNSFNALVASAQATDESQFHKIGEHSYLKPSFWPAESFPLYFTVRNGYLLLGAKPESMDQLSLEPSNRPLCSWMQKADQNLKVAQRSSISHFDMSKLDIEFPEDFKRDFSFIARFIAEGQFQSFTSVSGLDEYGFITRAEMVLGADLVESIDFALKQPLNLDSLKGLPVDPTMAITTRVDTQSFLKFLTENLGEEGTHLEDYLDSTDEFLGINVREDLLSAMDDQFFLYGHLNVPDFQKGWVIGARLKDEMSFEVSLSRATAKIKAYAEENGLMFERIPIGDSSIHQLDMGVGNFGIPSKVCYGMVDKSLVISFDAESIKEFHDRSVSPDSQYSARADVQRTFAFGKQEGLGEPLLIGDLHLAQIIKTLHPVVFGFLSGPITPQGELKFEDLPPVEALTDDVGPSHFAIFRQEQGFQVVMRQTYPGSGPIASLSTFGLWGIWASAIQK